LETEADHRAGNFENGRLVEAEPMGLRKKEMKVFSIQFSVSRFQPGDSVRLKTDHLKLKTFTRFFA